MLKKVEVKGEEAVSVLRQGNKVRVFTASKKKAVE